LVLKNVKAYRVNTKGIKGMEALDAKLAPQEIAADKDVKALKLAKIVVETDVTQMEEAKVEYDASNEVEVELDTEVTKQQVEEEVVAKTEVEIVEAIEEEEVAELDLDEEDKADIVIAKQEEEVKEKKIVAEENAANAQVVRNSLNSYYKTI